MQPIIPAPGPNGPWRVLILDRDPADPKWILATIATPDEIRPARADAIVDEVTAAWVASAAGLFRPALIPLPGASRGASMKEASHGEAGSRIDTTRQRPGPADH